MRSRLYLVLGSLLGVALIGIGLIWHDPHPFGSVFSYQTKEAATVTPLASCESQGFCEPHDVPSTATTTVATNAQVVRVIDGDTIVAKLDSDEREVTVRLLGINTPETVDPRKTVECFGKEASHETTELLTGKRVRLEADTQADERDKYDRLLRNVFLPDGTDVNALLVKRGYAYAYLSFPLKKERKKELRDLQELARTSLRGLWGAPCHSS